MTTPRRKAWGGTKIIPIACVYVFDQDNNLLLLQRHPNELGGGKWGAPGGYIEEGEDALVAASRELREETGIDSTDMALLGIHEVRMPHGAVHMTSFKTIAPKDTGVVIDTFEHQSYAWIGLGGILNQSNLLWGTPTILRDFGLLTLELDPTLADGSEAILLELAQ